MGSLVHSLVSSSSSSLLPEPPDLRITELLVSSKLPEPPDPPVVRGEEETPDPPMPTFPSVIPSTSLTVALRLVSYRDICVWFLLLFSEIHMLIWFHLCSLVTLILLYYDSLLQYAGSLQKFPGLHLASLPPLVLFLTFRTCWFSKVEMGTRITNSLRWIL